MTTKVTITVETDGEMTQVTREDMELGVALAGCVLRIEDQYPDGLLTKLAVLAQRELGRGRP